MGAGEEEEVGAGRCGPAEAAPCAPSGAVAHPGVRGWGARCGLPLGEGHTCLGPPALGRRPP